MKEQLFTSDEAQQVATTKSRIIVKPTPLRGVEVYLSSARNSRALFQLHYSCEHSTSFRCAGDDHCGFCFMGWTPRTHLYLACLLRSSGREAIACVSADTVNQWLERAPDFMNLFRIEKAIDGARQVRCVEITTHGRLPKPWNGFDVAEEMRHQFDRKEQKVDIRRKPSEK